MKTTQTQMPPLYPPLISSFHTRIGHLPEPEHPKGSALLQPVTDTFVWLKNIIQHPVSFLRSGFTRHSTSAAARWRPLVVLIHLSTQGRPQLRTLFTGFCEAALLLVLTFFFAAQWGGNLFITTIALALLLVFITLGRALAIVYGMSHFSVFKSQSLVSSSGPRPHMTILSDCVL